MSVQLTSLLDEPNGSVESLSQLGTVVIGFASPAPTCASITLLQHYFGQYYLHLDHGHERIRETKSTDTYLCIGVCAYMCARHMHTYDGWWVGAAGSQGLASSTSRIEDRKQGGSWLARHSTIKEKSPPHRLDE